MLTVFVVSVLSCLLGYVLYTCSSRWYGYVPREKKISYAIVGARLATCLQDPHTPNDNMPERCYLGCCDDKVTGELVDRALKAGLETCYVWHVPKWYELTH